MDNIAMRFIQFVWCKIKAVGTRRHCQDLPRGADGRIIQSSIPARSRRRIRKAFEFAAKDPELSDLILTLNELKSKIENAPAESDILIDEYINVRGTVAIHLLRTTRHLLSKKDRALRGQFAFLDVRIPGVDEELLFPTLNRFIDNKNSESDLTTDREDVSTELSITELFDEPNDFDLCQEVFSRIVMLHGDQLDVSKLTEYERNMILVWQSWGIIGNGGFQYLFEGGISSNEGFIYGDEGLIHTAAAYHKIGCERAAKVFEDALALFDGNQPPREIAKRISQYQSVSAIKRDVIDREFWRAKAEIKKSLAKYLRENRSEFAHLP